MSQTKILVNEVKAMSHTVNILIEQWNLSILYTIGTCIYIVHVPVWILGNEALNKFSVLDTSTMKSIVQCTWN